MQANLLHRKLNIWSGKREVLKCTSNTAVESNIGGSLSGCGSRLGVGHASTIQQVKSILPLMEEEPGGITSHINAEEEVQPAQVLQAKLGAKTTNDVAKLVLSGCSDDNIINIQKEHGDMIGPMEHE